MFPQQFHVDVRGGAKHVVRLVLSADAVERAADEVRPLVRFRRVCRAPVDLPEGFIQRHDINYLVLLCYRDKRDT